MGLEWKVDLFRAARDARGVALLQSAADYPNLAGDTTRPLLELEIEFVNGERERLQSLPRSVEALASDRIVKDFLATFGSGDSRFPPVDLWGCWRRCDGRTYEQLTHSNRLFGFDSLADEVRFLDLSLGNLIESFRPDLVSFRVNGATAPTRAEMDRGYLSCASPYLGYFGPHVLKSKPSEFWRDLVETILHPDPHAVGDPEEWPWIRHFKDGGFLYRFGGNSAVADARLAALFANGLGIRFRSA